ncbi:MAG: ABC transporter permease [Fimbriimonadaceae bacterium]|nr:MAG: ABC transporter permease [Fimbriimonadaceae bacterium]
MNVILSIAKTTIGEAIRRRVLLIILLIGVLFLVIAPGLSVLSARSSYTVLVSFTLGVIQLTSAVIAIVLTVYLLPNEVERRTIYTILSKPVYRWQFLLGKYLGAVGALGLMMALMTGILVLVFKIMQAEAGMDVVMTLARAPMMYFVQMSLLAAVAMFFSTFASPIVNFFLTGGVYLVGTLFSPVFQDIAGNNSVNAMVKTAATVIHTLVPNFAQFNVQNTIINSGSQLRSEQMYYLQMVAYAIAYVAVFLIGGMMIFDRKEV